MAPARTYALSQDRTSAFKDAEPGSSLRRGQFRAPLFPLCVIPLTVFSCIRLHFHCGAGSVTVILPHPLLTSLPVKSVPLSVLLVYEVGWYVCEVGGMCTKWVVFGGD